MEALKKLSINVVHHLLRLWWFVTRPSGRGAKVVLVFEDEILLVRHNYGHGLWTIPGGGVKTNEESVVGGKREIFEELKVEVSDLVKIGSYFSDYEYKKVEVDCFKAKVLTREVQPDNFEIVEARWFYLNELPSERASSVNKILNLYVSDN